MECSERFELQCDFFFCLGAEVIDRFYVLGCQRDHILNRCAVLSDQAVKRPNREIQLVNRDFEAALLESSLMLGSSFRYSFLKALYRT